MHRSIHRYWKIVEGEGTHDIRRFSGKIVSLQNTVNSLVALDAQAVYQSG